jgi:hypothetical protein
LLESAKGKPEREIIRLVNSGANRLIRYASDQRAFRREDYWASPFESLKNRGDCEDFAILKYVSLRELGFSEDRLRIVVLNDTLRGLGHAVLSVRFDNEILVLDNQISRPTPHFLLKHYKPVYSLNAHGRWINLATRPAKRHLVASLNDAAAALPETGAVRSGRSIVVPRPKPARVIDGLSMTALAQPIRLSQTNASR